MSFRQQSSMDIGLRHVLEAGLHFVRKDEPAEENRDVLKSLVEILSEAGRGSQVIQRRELLVGIEDRPAFERFSVFFKYLKDSLEGDLPSRLNEAVSVFDNVRHGRRVEVAERQRAAELVEKLLLAMRRDAALTRLVSPKTVVYE